jgi:ubiquinone biosynthesis protein
MKRGRSAILRLFQIVFLVFKYACSYLLSRTRRVRQDTSVQKRHPLLRDMTGPERLRLFLQEVDGALIKIGQILAMRVDFLPAQYVQELLKLLDEVPPFSAKESREIIERELGGNIFNLFASFAEKPMAAASFAQVHAATLPGGQEVVVKVQRPDVEDTMAADLKLFRAVAFFIDATGLTRRTPLKAVYTEFAEWSREELDFRIEGSHIQEIYTKARRSPTEKIPKVHWAFTTRRVLTLERLHGIWVKDVMQQLETDRERVIERLKEYDTSLVRISTNLLRNTLRQVFEYGVYHSDPHGGNLLIMPGGRIGYVDFGITGRIGFKARQQQVNIHIALESGDFERFYNAILDTIEVPYFADLSHFKNEVVKNYKVWLRAQYMGSGNVREKSFARLMLAINQAAQKADIGFRSMEVRIFRTMATVDAILLDFAPTLDVRKEFRRFFTHYNMKTLMHVDIPELLQKLPTVVRRQSEELDVHVVEVIPRVSRTRRVLSHIFRAVAIVFAVIAVLILFRLGAVLSRLSEIGIGWGAALAIASVAALFFLWLSNILHLRSIVRDEIVLPPERRRIQPNCERGYDSYTR